MDTINKEELLQGVIGMYLLSRREMLTSVAFGAASVALSGSAFGQDVPDIKRPKFKRVTIKANGKFVRPGMTGTQLDVMQHVQKDPWDFDVETLPIDKSPAVFTHENMHVLNDQIFDEFNERPEYKYRVSILDYRGHMCSVSGNQAAYLGNGEAAIVKTPCGISITHAGYAVPYFVTKTVTFQDYFIDKNAAAVDEGRTAPLPVILVHEASAYLLHGRVSLELAETDYYKRVVGKGRLLMETESAGQFVLYLLALGAEIEKKGRAAYSNDEDRDQMYGVIQYLVEGLADVYQKGMDRKKYPHLCYYRPNCLKKLTSDNTTASLNIKNFAARVYGRDWLPSLHQNDAAQKLVVTKSLLVNRNKLLSHSEIPQPASVYQQTLGIQR